MGLSKESMGLKSIDTGLVIQKKEESDLVVALAGNPNVGKSTVFNGLTGLKQHTGNWPGKTVANAQGYCSYGEQGYVLVDIPGCYSLMAHSAEEEVARDFICFEHPDGVAVVCDATCLERNMNLVLQILEATPKVVVCVNLMDEAKKKKIRIDLPMLEKKLGVPVAGMAARSGKGLNLLFDGLKRVMSAEGSKTPIVPYEEYIEGFLEKLIPVVETACPEYESCRWLAARLLETNENLLESVNRYLGFDIMEHEAVKECLARIYQEMEELGIGKEKLSDDIASAFIRRAEEICRDVVSFENKTYARKDRLLDRLFTSRLTGFPIMFLVLLGIFWLTITGANYPSALLSEFLFGIEDRLAALFASVGVPGLLTDMLVHGVYRVLAWVVSVMLPPMAIFFPLFTLLEDFGYLPRVAFNLDRCFKRCQACGKQALTMCMGGENL